MTQARHGSHTRNASRGSASARGQPTRPHPRPPRPPRRGLIGKLHRGPRCSSADRGLTGPRTPPRSGHRGPTQGGGCKTGRHAAGEPPDRRRPGTRPRAGWGADPPSPARTRGPKRGGVRRPQPAAPSPSPPPLHGARHPEAPNRQAGAAGAADPGAARNSHGRSHPRRPAAGKSARERAAPFIARPAPRGPSRAHRSPPPQRPLAARTPPSGRRLGSDSGGCRAPGGCDPAKRGSGSLPPAVADAGSAGPCGAPAAALAPRPARGGPEPGRSRWLRDRAPRRPRRALGQRVCGGRVEGAPGAPGRPLGRSLGIPCGAQSLSRGALPWGLQCRDGRVLTSGDRQTGWLGGWEKDAPFLSTHQPGGSCLRAGGT